MNFSVSNGNLREKVQDPDSQFENVLNDFKRKIDQSKSKLEDRYMIDTDFKEKADTAECKEDYYEREIFDQQFEIDFMCALTASIKGRYESNSESESSSEEESSQEEKFEHKNRERKDRRR